MEHEEQRIVRRLFHFFRDDTGLESIEAAITIPIMITIMLAIFQFGILVYTTQMTQEAARQGARMGSVVQGGGGAAVARSEAAAYIHRALPIGSPRVDILAPGGIVGSYLRVRVTCTVPNYMGSLVPGLPPQWDVRGEATFRQEGW